MGWRWLRRMKSALILLGVLGLLSLIATVVPQQPNVPTTVEEWRTGVAGPGEFWAGILDAFGAFDVYGSPAFMALLALLFTSLTACLIPRYRAIWRLARRSRPPRTRDLLAHDHHDAFEVDATPDEAHAAAREVLRARRFRLRAGAAATAAGGDAEADAPDVDGAPKRTQPDQPDQVAAEKGHLFREGGSLIFHTSFYVLLIGVVVGQLIGCRGQVGVIEGNSWAETAVGYWSYHPGRFWGAEDHRGFVMSLDRFDVDWWRDPRFGGQPKLFQSNITVTTSDGRTYSDTIGGNDPAVIEDMKVHQLDWGYAPRVVVSVDGEVVHDAFLTFGATDGIYWHGAVKAPAADPDIGLDAFLVPYAPLDEDGQPQLTGWPGADDPLLLFTMYRGDLRMDRVQNVNDLDTTGLVEVDGTAIRLGEGVELADGVVVAFPELRRWVGFQISRRPTVPLLLFGSLLVLLGLIPALYAYRRRVWVEAAPDPETGRTRVAVAGRAFQRPQAFEDEFADIVTRLRSRLGADGPTNGRGRAATPDSTPDATPSTTAPDPTGGETTEAVR